MKDKKEKEKKPGRFMKLQLIGMFTFLFVFTIAILVIFVITGGMEPTSLVIAVFGICGVEGGILGWIKNNKIKSSRKDEVDKYLMSPYESNESDTSDITDSGTLEENGFINDEEQ